MKEFFFENFNKATPVAPMCDFGRADLSYVAHFHEEIELIYVLSGSIEASNESGSFTAFGGDICLFMPGEIHSYRTDGHSRVYLMKLYAPGTSSGRELTLMRLESNLLREGGVYDKILAAVNAMERESREKRTGWEFALNMYANGIILDMLRGLCFETIEPQRKKQLYEKLELLGNVNRFISENYAQPVSLESVSGALNFSKHYFAHRFKAITSTGFYEYLTVYRLKKAADMLKMSTQSITEIGYACGFSNIRSFNRMFKSHYGMTPGEYRFSNTRLPAISAGDTEKKKEKG